MSKSTKIVATISDKRCDVEFLQTLFDEGMNVVRMNSAHLDAVGFTKIITNVRAVSNQIAILMDTKGPEVRTTIAQDDEMSWFLQRHECEERAVLGAFELFALEMIQHFDFFAAEDFLQQSFSQDETFGFLFSFAVFIGRQGSLNGDVIHLRANCHGHVGGQCPGRGGPDQ